MDDQTAKDPDNTSEVPVGLEANKGEAEYGSDVMVDMLERLGFDYITLTPGSTFRGIHDSLINHGRNHKPQIILCPSEEIAVSLMQGYSKATGRTGAVILHNLVGLQHAMMSFWNAAADRMPMLVLGGSGPANPAERRYIDWLHSSNVQSDLMRPYAKWTNEPPTIQATVDAMARACRISANAPAGLTYISIDTGLQEATLDGAVELPEPTLPRYQPTPPMAAAPDSIGAAADLLCEANLPLIIGGRIGIRADVTKPLVELVELTGAAYQEGKDVVCMPTNHAQNLTGGFGASKETEIRGLADAVLAIDCHDVMDLLGGYGKARGGGYGYIVGGDASTRRRVIDLSINDLAVKNWATIGGDLSPYDVQIFADPVFGLTQLLEEMKRRAKGTPAWRKRAKDNARTMAERHAALRARQQEVLKEHWADAPIAVARMIYEVWEAVKGKPWVLSVRNYRSWYEGIWKFDGGGQYLGNNAGAGVGYGPGGAVGSALAARDQGRFPVAIMGDGDFTMNPAAIWTAVHYNIPMLVVLHNNTSFGNDEEHQVRLARDRGRPTENAWIGQRMAGPAIDYAGVARSYGAFAEGPVENPDDLAGALTRSVAEVEKGGVALIDVRTAVN